MHVSRRALSDDDVTESGGFVVHFIDTIVNNATSKPITEQTTVDVNLDAISFYSALAVCVFVSNATKPNMYCV